MRFIHRLVDSESAALTANDSRNAFSFKNTHGDERFSDSVCQQPVSTDAEVGA